MNEQALLALYIHLSGKKDATLEDVAKTFEILGFSPSEVMNVSPFDVLRSAEILKRLKSIEEAVAGDVSRIIGAPLGGSPLHPYPSPMPGPYIGDALPYDSNIWTITTSGNTKEQNVPGTYSFDLPIVNVGP